MSIAEAEKIVYLQEPTRVPDELLKKSKLTGSVLIANSDIGIFKAAFYTLAYDEEPKLRTIREMNSSHVVDLAPGERFALSLSTYLTESAFTCLTEEPQSVNPMHKHRYLLTALARIDEQPIAQMISTKDQTTSITEKLVGFDLKPDSQQYAYCNIVELHREDEFGKDRTEQLTFQPLGDSRLQQLQVIILQATERTIYRRKFSPAISNIPIAKLIPSHMEIVRREMVASKPIAAFSIDLTCLNS